MKKNQRWYDVDPVVSRATEMLEHSAEDIQIICAEYVIDKLKDMDFEMSLDEQFNYIMRRWYDKNIKVSHAMEYLKHAPDDIRRELALDIIEYIEKNSEK